MKQMLLFIALAIYLISIPLMAQDSASVTLPPDETILSWLRTEKIPAVGMATIENGKIDQLKVLGELAPGRIAQQGSLFDVASLTKSITTYLTMKLVSTGDWHLDEPLYHYWTDPDVKEDPFHRKLTTRHALSHRSGFLNWRYMDENGKLNFTFEPGTKLGYSGEGFEYVRRAMERKFKVPFHQLVDSIVFEPLGMNNSFLLWEDKIDSLHIALPHDAEGQPYVYQKVDEAKAADDLLLSVQDMATFGIAILKEKEMKPQVYEEMIQLYAEVKPQAHFGLGWIIFPDLKRGEYALLNAGSDRGVNAVIVLLPNSQRGLVVMTNGDNGRSLIMRIVGQGLDVGKEVLQRL